jgi:uncharacterized protein YycO
VELRSRFISRAITIIVIVVVLVAVFVVRNTSLPAISPQADILQPGDIFFVDLYKGWSHGGYWDHLALYVGNYAVVEATYNGGVCYTPVEAFLERDKPAEISVKRLKEMPSREEIIHQAIEYALDQVGKPFDFTATVTFPLKVNEENQHCAEVIWRAYKSAGVDLDSDDGVLLYPDDIYYSPWLEPI